MSDTTQMILWIVLGLVVRRIHRLVLRLGDATPEDRGSAAGRRRSASVPRGGATARDPRRRGPSSHVTTEIAQDARAEAEEKAAEAARLERHAEKHRAEAEAAARERESLSAKRTGSIQTCARMTRAIASTGQGDDSTSPRSRRRRRSPRTQSQI